MLKLDCDGPIHRDFILDPEGFVCDNLITVIDQSKDNANCLHSYRLYNDWVEVVVTTGGEFVKGLAYIFLDRFCSEGKIYQWKN